MCFDKFLSLYHQGFVISNNIFSLDTIKNKLEQNHAYLEQSGDNFFLTQNGFITYFINDIVSFDMQGIYIKLIYKTKICELENKFLSINKFGVIDNYVGMSLKNSGFSLQNSDEVKKALLDDINEIYSFFINYFDKEYLFMSKDELKNKISNGFVFIIKHNKRIIGALVYSLNLNSAHLEFIAVDEEFRQNGSGHKLMSRFLGLDAWYFKLFVRETNIKAINFYKKFGFKFNTTKISFYKRKNEV